MKSHEQYVKELSEKNPNVKAIDKYSGATTPIKHLCKIHNVEWYSQPHNVLYGAGCPQCKIERSKKSKGYDTDWYINKLSIKNPNVELIGKYTNQKTQTAHRCKIHDYIWYPMPSTVLNGCGCPKCKSDKSKKNILSNDTYCQRLKSVNPNIVPLEEYKGGLIPILHLCKKHDVKRKIVPNYALNGTGCELCEKENRHAARAKTHEKYIKELEELNPNVVCLEKYIDGNTPILHLCKIHNKEWKISPSSALRGTGCKQCGIERSIIGSTKTTDEYINELTELGLTDNIAVLEDYKGANIPIAHLCKTHNEIWYPTPSNVLRGNSLGCLKCNFSKGESIIEKWLKNHNISYEPQKTFEDCKDSRVLPFDFYLPKNNKCIEFDGKQHFEPIDHFGGEESFETLQRHDRMKRNYCRTQRIPLLRINYKDKDIDTKLEEFLFN